MNKRLMDITGKKFGRLLIRGNMKNRCLNPKADCWKDYGGRGIRVFELHRDSRWIEKIMTGTMNREIVDGRQERSRTITQGNQRMETENCDLELYLPESDLKLRVEEGMRSRIIKTRAAGLCIQYPQAFCLLPVSDLPPRNGTWGRYEFDGAFTLWVNSSHPEALSFYQRILSEEKEMIMSQELTKKEDAGIKQMLAANIKAIKTVLPKHMTPERMMRIAFTAISRSPGLARCTPISLLNAVIEASILGLEVNSPLGQASMVPFWNSKTGHFEAQLIPEYKGKIELAYRSGMVKSFQAHPVFEKDKFSYRYGLSPDLVHVPSKEADRGKLIAAYAVVNYLNGGVDFEVIEEGEAMAAKAKSASAKKDEKNKTSDSVWNSEDEPAMWMKTAVHRLFKRVPKSPEYIQIARAQELSARADAGEPQDFDFLNAEIAEGHEPIPIGDGSGTETKAEPGNGSGKASPLPTPEVEKKEPEKEKAAGKTEEPPPPTEPPKKETAKQNGNAALHGSGPLFDKPAKGKGSPMDQLRALEKENRKLYDQACKEAEIPRPMSESAAILVLKKSNEILDRPVERKGKK